MTSRSSLGKGDERRRPFWAKALKGKEPEWVKELKESRVKKIVVRLVRDQALEGLACSQGWVSICSPIYRKKMFKEKKSSHLGLRKPRPKQDNGTWKIFKMSARKWNLKEVESPPKRKSSSYCSRENRDESLRAETSTWPQGHEEGDSQDN